MHYEKIQTLNGVMVKVTSEDEEMLNNPYVLRQITKGSNRYKTKDFGIKVSENSALQDIKNSCITNRRVQRTCVGLYEFKFKGNEYLFTVCDSPNQSESSCSVNILGFDKTDFQKS